MRTDLSYWVRGIRYLVSLLPFGKPTRLAIRHMREFPYHLMTVIRLGLKGTTRGGIRFKGGLVARVPLSESIQQELFIASFADALWKRLQADINKNMVEDLREAYRAAELQKGS